MEMEHQLFYLSIQALMKSWTGLQIAIANGFGGSHSEEKAQWLVGTVESYFNNNSSIEPWELEEFIEEIFFNEFDVINEDDSIKTLSVEICSAYKLYKEGKHKEIRDRLKLLPCVNVSESIKVDQETVSPSKEINHLSEKLTANLSTDDVSPAVHNNAIDDDGWTVIKTRRNKK